MEAQDEAVDVVGAGPVEVQEGEVQQQQGAEGQVVRRVDEVEAPQPTEVSPEQFLAFLAEDFKALTAELAVLKRHHSITVNMMKMLAGHIGLEMFEDRRPDGQTVMGWRQKIVVAGPGSIPPNAIPFPGRRG